MRVLVTRPREDAEALVAELAARGHAAVVQPLLEIRHRPQAAPDLDGVQAVLFTSANGVRAFAAASRRRDLPAYAVGEATAEAARAAGFAEVASAGGDVADLAVLAQARLEPTAGALLHAAGSVTAGDLQGRLAAAGFRVRRAQLYEARAVEALAGDTRRALSAGELDAAVFFSPRSAETFVNLAREAGLADACGGLQAVCLSQAVAERARALPWRAVRVAARPERDALLEALEAAAKGAMPSTTPESRSTSPAQQVIARFGGIRPMAQKLGLAVSTVQGWKTRGAIPPGRHAAILAAAEKHGVALDRELLARAGEGRAAPAEAAARTHAAGAEAEAAAAAEPATPAADTAPASDGQVRAADAHAAGAEAEAAAVAEGEDGPAARAAAPALASAKPGPAAGEPGRPGLLPGMLLGAAILAVGIGAALALRDLWAPSDGTPPGLARVEQRLSALEEEQAQAAALREEVAGLRETVQGLEGGADPARLKALGGRLDELRAELDALAGRLDEVAAAAPDEAALGKLAERVDALETRLDERLAAVSERLAAVEEDAAGLADVRARLDELAARVAEAGETARTAAARRTALALAVAQLRDALRFAAPFEAELAAARGLAREAELKAALQPLAAHAAAGVPTREMLGRQFGAAAGEAMAAAAGEEAEGWLGGVLRRLSDIVTVRPVGLAAEGDGPGAVLARAEAHLEAGELADAVAALDGLSGPAAEAMAGWRKRAEARLAAERALSRLSARLMERLAAGTGAGG